MVQKKIIFTLVMLLILISCNQKVGRLEGMELCKQEMYLCSKSCEIYPDAVEYSECQVKCHDRQNDCYLNLTKAYSHQD